MMVNGAGLIMTEAPADIQFIHDMLTGSEIVFKDDQYFISTGSYIIYRDDYNDYIEYNVYDAVHDKSYKVKYIVSFDDKPDYLGIYLSLKNTIDYNKLGIPHKIMDIKKL